MPKVTSETCGSRWRRTATLSKAGLVVTVLAILINLWIDHVLRNVPDQRGRDLPSGSLSQFQQRLRRVL